MIRRFPISHFLTLCFSFVVALDPPSSWSLTAQASGKSLILDWSSFPNDLNTEYFIVFLNQTEIHENNDHRYDHENYNPIRMLRFFNLSETEVNVSDIPAATEFQAVVYLVAVNNDIYKSQTLTIKSAEGGKKLKFFFLYTPSQDIRSQAGCQQIVVVAGNKWKYQNVLAVRFINYEISRFRFRVIKSYSFSKAIPIFFNRYKNDFILV